MRTSNSLFTFFFIVFLLVGTSCKKDDNSNNPTETLIGEWLRSDASESFEERYTFDSDLSGFYVLEESPGEGTGMSTAVTFEWSVNNDRLTLLIFDEERTTRFFFNDDRQLVLQDFSSIPFDRVD